MKRTALLVFIAFGFNFAFAQGVQLGVKAGINNGTLSSEIPGVTTGTIKRGFTGGVFGRASLLGFFAQPEIGFSQRSGNFDEAGKKFTNNLAYMDITVLVGYSLIGVVRANVGPCLMTLLSASQTADAGVGDPNFSKSNFNSTAYGLQYGVGFDIASLCIDLRYDMNITNLGKQGINSPGKGILDYRTGYSIFQITLGYKLFKI